MGLAIIMVSGNTYHWSWSSHSFYSIILWPRSYLLGGAGYFWKPPRQVQKPQRRDSLATGIINRIQEKYSTGIINRIQEKESIQCHRDGPAVPLPHKVPVPGTIAPTGVRIQHNEGPGLH